jgi:hypothetical protein
MVGSVGYFPTQERPDLGGVEMTDAVFTAGAATLRI